MQSPLFIGFFLLNVCFIAYYLIFPQMWKSLFTDVENLFHNCGKPFPRLWKD